MEQTPFDALDPIATGDYPSPRTDQQWHWTPEDGIMDDLPLIMADAGRPTVESETPVTLPDGLTLDEFKSAVREEIPS